MGKTLLTPTYHFLFSSYYKEEKKLWIHIHWAKFKSKDLYTYEYFENEVFPIKNTNKNNDIIYISKIIHLGTQFLNIEEGRYTVVKLENKLKEKLKKLINWDKPFWILDHSRGTFKFFSTIKNKWEEIKIDDVFQLKEIPFEYYKFYQIIKNGDILEEKFIEEIPFIEDISKTKNADKILYKSFPIKFEGESKLENAVLHFRNRVLELFPTAVNKMIIWNKLTNKETYALLSEPPIIKDRVLYLKLKLPEELYKEIKGKEISFYFVKKIKLGKAKVKKTEMECEFELFGLAPEGEFYADPIYLWGIIGR